MDARSVGEKISEGRRNVGMALAVSIAAIDGGSEVRIEAEAPCAGCHVPAGNTVGDAQSGAEQAGDTAHLEAFLRDAFAGKWNGYPDRAGVAGACGRRDDADLHARDAEAGVGSAESTGWVSAGALERWSVGA